MCPPENIADAPPAISAERRAELDARRLENAIPIADVIADLKRQAEALRNSKK